MPIERLAAPFLGLIALLHLVRLVFQVEVWIGGIPIPLWVSVLGSIVTGGLAVLPWRESDW
jgi:hypothetical protein